MHVGVLVAALAKPSARNRFGKPLEHVGRGPSMAVAAVGFRVLGDQLELGVFAVIEVLLALEAAFVVASLAARRLTKGLKAVFVLVVVGMTSDTRSLRFDFRAVFGVAVVALDFLVRPRELESSARRVIKAELGELALLR